MPPSLEVVKDPEPDVQYLYQKKARHKRRHPPSSQSEPIVVSDSDDEHDSKPSDRYLPPNVSFTKPLICMQAGFRQENESGKLPGSCPICVFGHVVD